MGNRNELMKFLIEELNQDPFKYGFNLASFGSLKGRPLWSLLQDVLCSIDPKYKEERYATYNSVEQERMMELLRVLRYWPKFNSMENVQQGLEELIPETLLDIMVWIFQRKDELKQRAYLAKFLVKIHIPDEFMLDDEVVHCYEEYEQTMDEFKEAHKKLENLTQDIENGVGELVRDLERIDYDIDCLSRKVDGVKSRVGDFSEKSEYLEQARELRKARDKKLKLEKQMCDEESKLMTAKRKVETMYGRLTDMTDINKHSTPESALARLEQDADILRIIVEQRLPKKIEDAGRCLLAMRITEDRPPECRADLEYTRQKLNEVNKEIAFYESKVRGKEQDASLNFAKSQASQNVQKKLQLTEEFELMKEDLAAIREEIDEKCREKRLKFRCEDDFLLTPEGYRDYVKDMRIKAGKYKVMRSELQALQAEVGHLSTTKFIIEGEVKESEEDLKLVENQLGIVGFTDTQEKLENLSSEKSVVEKKKMESIYEMATLAKDLNDQVQQRKTELEPLVSEVQKQREALQELEIKAKLAKVEMDEEINPIKEKIEKLEEHIGQLQESYERDQTEFIKMQGMIPVLKTNISRVTEIVAKEVNGTRARTYREKLLSKMVETERVYNCLENQMNVLDDVLAYETKQKQMWSDLTNTIKVKLEIQRSLATEIDLNNDGGIISLSM